MKKLKLTTLFFIISTTAHANFETVQNCINQKYKMLSNRDAIAAAVVDVNQTKIMTFGNAKADSIFEIGSLTKTFTGLLLAKSVADGVVNVNDPIPAEYQKEGSVITYKGLTTHSSGIIGGNFADYESPNDQSPYQGLSISIFKQLYAHTPLEYTPGEQWVYSNIGSGLLGLVLSERAQMTYEDLVPATLFSALEMNDSYFEVPTPMQDRFLQGHVRLGDEIQPYSHWDLFGTAINPAGGLRSTITDMVKYARAQLAPESSTLKDAIELSHKPLFKIPDAPMQMGMNWILIPGQDLIWHNGSTIGFNSILIISKKQNLAVVAMTNTGVYKIDQAGEVSGDDSLQNIAFACLE